VAETFGVRRGYAVGARDMPTTRAARSRNRGCGYFPPPSAGLTGASYIGTEPGDFQQYFASVRPVGDIGEKRCGSRGFAGIAGTHGTTAVTGCMKRTVRVPYASWCEANFGKMRFWSPCSSCSPKGDIER
jgi:hypothetical protein